MHHCDTRKVLRCPSGTSQRADPTTDAHGVHAPGKACPRSQHVRCPIMTRGPCPSTRTRPRCPNATSQRAVPAMGRAWRPSKACMVPGPSMGRTRAVPSLGRMPPYNGGTRSPCPSVHFLVKIALGRFLTVKICRGPVGPPSQRPGWDAGGVPASQRWDIRRPNSSNFLKKGQPFNKIPYA